LPGGRRDRGGAGGGAPDIASCLDFLRSYVDGLRQKKGGFPLDIASLIAGIFCVTRKNPVACLKIGVFPMMFVVRSTVDSLGGPGALTCFLACSVFYGTGNAQ
jgi:hypothetical protein